MNIRNQSKYRHSFLRSLWHTVIPGLDPESNVYNLFYYEEGCFLDSGSNPE